MYTIYYILKECLYIYTYKLIYIIKHIMYIYLYYIIENSWPGKFDSSDNILILFG